MALFTSANHFTFTERKSSRSDDVPAISITSDDPERNVAIVSVTPAIFQGEVVINQVQIHDDNRQTRTRKSESLDFPPPLPSPPPSPPLPAKIATLCLLLPAPQLISDCDASNKNTSDTTIGSSKTQISEQDVKKITRSLNNNNNGNGGTKRKVKLRRLGSRQNSKTESDSDDDSQNVVLDAPRRVKRKTSRAKRGNDSQDKTEELPTPTDDVVYVLKIKPGHLIEQTEVSVDFKLTVDETTDYTHQLHQGTTPEENASTNNASNVFVKTKRKIFTPAPDNLCGAVIAKDLDTTSSSSASDKLESVHKTGMTESKIVKNLPPLPQSPGMLRRLEQQKANNQPKEPSPAIRLMIAKYNQRLSTERRASSPQSSGSCSPVVWRSPVSERRVRTQTEKYLSKSSSAGNVQRDAKLSVAITPHHRSDTKDGGGGVLKSLSAGIISSNWARTNSEQDDDQECGTFLACDSLKKISSIQRGSVSPFDFDKASEKVYRKNTEYPIPFSVSKSGTYKKILATTAIRSKDELVVAGRQQQDELPDKATNTLPRIKRKYDVNPPSPKTVRSTSTTATPIRASLELNIRNPNLSLPKDPNAVDTPLSDRAQKLRKAKEEFLRTAGHRSACYCQDGEEVWKNRLSQISAGSESSVDERMITKSASVGMINSSGVDAIALQRSSLGPSSNAAATTAGYGSSLPRNTTRPSKSQGTIGKFGFSSIASKLRNVALRKNSKELPSKPSPMPSGMAAVSTLCRQSLMVDVSKADRERKERERRAAEAEKQKSQSTEKLRKSGSAQAMGFGSLLFRRHERAEKLKKSKSIGQLDAGH